MSISGNNWQGGITNFKTSLTGNNNSAVSTNKIIHDPSPIFERLRKGDRTALKDLGDFIVQARDTSCLETQTLVKWKKTPLDDGQVKVKLVYLARTVTVNYTPKATSTTLSAPKLTPEQALENKIKEMKLRSTNCKGVYCQLVADDGTYRNQKHYVWNPVSQEMKELIGIFAVNSKGTQAYKYGDVQAHIQGYEFTEEEGVYLKDGNKYIWSVEGKCFKRQSLTSLGSVSTRLPEIKEEPEKDPNAVYDENGNMISKKFFDENNRIKAEEFYDTDGNIISSTTYTYNSNGTYTTTVKNNDGTQVQKEFDSNNNLISEKKYNAEGQLISNIKYDSNGNKVFEQTLEYDSAGRVTLDIQTDGQGNTMAHTEFVYNSDGSFVETTIANDGSKVEKEFAPNGKITSEKTFDTEGRIVKEENQDQFGNVTESFEYIYEADGSYTKKYTNNDGNFVEEKYSSDNKLLNTTITDEFGRMILDIDYDNNGKVQDKVEFSYENGITKIITNKDGTSIEQQLDNEGNVLSEIFYNAFGTVTAENRYNAKGQLIYRRTVVPPATEEYTYHENGNYSITKTQYGIKTESLLTSEGKLIEEKTFDSSGRAQRVITYNTDGSREATKNYDYNRDGSYVVTSDYSNGTSKAMQYDRGGKLTFEATYDENGNLLLEIEYYHDGSVFASRTFYSNGAIQTETNLGNYGNNYITNIYDEKGNLVKQTFTDRKGNLVKEVIVNSDGNTVTTTYKDGNVENETVTTPDGKMLSETIFDENGKITQKVTVDSNGNTVKINFKNDIKVSETITTPNGKMLSETLFDENGKITQKVTIDSNGNTVTTTYKDGNVENEIVITPDGNIIKGKIFDNDGNLLKDVKQDADGNTVTINFKNDIKISETVTTPDGKMLSETIFDENGKITQKVTVDSNGNTVTTTYKDGDVENVIVITPDGNIIKGKIFDNDGNLLKDVKQDADGNTVTINFKNDIKVSETVTTPDGKVVSETLFDENGQITQKFTVDSNGNTVKIVYENDKKVSETIIDNKGNETTTHYDASDRIIKVETGNKNGVVSITEYEYLNNGGTKVTEKDKDGNIISVTTTEVKNNQTIVTVKNANGKTISKTTSYTDSNGKPRTDMYTYDTNGKITSKKVNTISAANIAYEYNYTYKDGKMVSYTADYTNGDYKYHQTYNSKYQITAQTLYKLNGQVHATYTYEYPEDLYIDNSNYTRIDRCSNGDVITRVYENGFQTKAETKKANGDVSITHYDVKTLNGKQQSVARVTYYRYKNGAIKVTEYDANGKAKGSARSRLTGSISYSGATLSAQGLYDGITTKLDRTVISVLFFSFTGAECVREMADGPYAERLLRVAQASYNGTPTGCSKKYSNYKSAPAEYQDFIKNDLIKALQEEYGYNPEDVKGYYFPTTSDMSKSMAGDSDLKTYVKKYIKDLVNGKAPSAALSFNKNKDLSYALHGTNVLGAKLNGTKLTLTIYDMYDFNSKATGNGGSAVLNRAGAAAMKDGLLKPYFMLFEVTIDLKTLGFTQAQINALKNS